MMAIATAAEGLVVVEEKEEKDSIGCEFCSVEQALKVRV